MCSVFFGFWLSLHCYISVGIHWCTLRSGKPGIALTACRSALSVFFLVVIGLDCVVAAFALAIAFFAMSGQRVGLLVGFNND